MQNKFSLRMKHFLTLLLLFFLLTISLVSQGQMVTVTTDMDDYYPGEWVIITGSGWQNDANVQLTLTHLDPLPDPLHTHETWQVQPNEEGYIYYEWFVEEQELNTSFQLDALGLTTGLIATTHFTDGNVKDLIVSPQIGTLTYGKGGTVTYNIRVSSGSGGSTYNYVTMSVSNLPSGITHNFSASKFFLTDNTYYDVRLTLMTSEITQVPVNNEFTIRATGTSGPEKTYTAKVFINKANQTLTWSNPTNIIYGSLLSANQLNAIVAGTTGGSSPGALTYTPTLGTLLNAGTHTLQVDAAETSNYKAATKQVTLVIDKAEQTITWSNPTSIIYGTLLSGTQLNATVAGVTGGSAPGGITYNLAPGTLLNAGTHTLTVNIAPTSNYGSASATVTLIVDKADQTISWEKPSNIVYGTLLSGMELNATVTGSSTIGALSPSALTYTPPAGSILNAGSHTLHVDAAETINYNAASKDVTIEVDKAPTTTVVTVFDATYDGNNHEATASVISGIGLNQSLSVVYTGTGSTIYGPTVTAPTNAGSYIALASYEGDINHEVSSDSIPFIINPAVATVNIVGETWTYDAAEHGASITTANGVLGEDLSAFIDLGEKFINFPGGKAHWTFINPNYVSRSGNVNITINKADAVVMVTGYKGVYDALTHGATGSAVGVFGDPAAAGSTLNLGSSFTDYPGGTAHWTFTGGTNYLDESGDVAIVIDKATITIVVDNKSKYCGEGNPQLTGAVTGIQSGDGIDVKYSTTATVYSKADAYAIEASIEDPRNKLKNYNLSITNGTLTINSVFIDASTSSTPVALGNVIMLSAKVTSDALGVNGLAGIPVTFTLDNGTNTVSFIPEGKSSTSAITVVTGIDGIAKINIAALPVEVYKITAEADPGCAYSVAYLAVYDPSAGFVTGGGWITSPVGAYLTNTSLTGKANFGFVSKYRKGSNVPEGNTEFQFQTGNLNFSSSSYSTGSLVIAGSQAIYKGFGTINGAGSYNFMVSAVDGQVTGGGGADKFRIKIWDAGGTIYDNNVGNDENATASTAMGGGSIVIHSNVNTKKVAQITPEAPVAVFEPVLKAYPNPFTERLNIEFSYETDTKARLEIYSVTGAKLQTLYAGPVAGGQLYTFEYLPRLNSSQVVFYHLTLDGKTHVGKMLYNQR